jgi:glutamine synthetase
MLPLRRLLDLQASTFSPKMPVKLASPKSPAPPAEARSTPLASFAKTKFDVGCLEAFAGGEVAGRFKECLVTGDATSPADRKAIEKALFDWCATHGCINYAHWFFPMRSGGGLAGSTAGMKHDTFLNPDWGAAGMPGCKPFQAEMPGGRLFNGETDGSSFPNGGLRVTHAAAAFTAWDRGSPPFICTLSTAALHPTTTGP